MTETEIDIGGRQFRVMRQPKSDTTSTCKLCWFFDTNLECPKGASGDIHSLKCVDMDAGRYEVFFVLMTEEGYAKYAANRLEGKP